MKKYKYRIIKRVRASGKIEYEREFSFDRGNTWNNYYTDGIHDTLQEAKEAIDKSIQYAEDKEIIEETIINYPDDN